MKTIITILFCLLLKNGKAQDTIKVVMLYSDTAITELVGTDDDGNDYGELGLDEYCYWRKGFKVGDNYLDADKKRIPETNCVWFYKTLK